MEKIQPTLVFELQHDCKWNVLRLQITHDSHDKQQTQQREFILQHPHKLAKDIVNNIRAGLPDFLDPFRVAVGRDPIRLTPDLQEAALEYLENTSEFLLRELGFGRGLSTVNALKEFIGPFLTTAEMPVIELRGAVAEPLIWYVPFELLPLYGLPGESHERQTWSVSQKLDSYLGFHAIIIRARDFTEHELDRDDRGRIPIRIGTYRGGDLRGVISQLNYLRNRQEFTQIHVWPDLNTVPPHMAAAGLAGLLNGAIGLVHLCCHLDDKGLDQVFEFGTEKQPLSVRLSQLIGALARLPDVMSPAAGAPLIFLNTCRSAALSPHKVSLLRELQDWGYTDMIGGEALLPHLLAGEFACIFYDQLLLGVPTGRAIVKTRDIIRKTYHNPGGLLYTLYGNPQIYYNEVN